MRVPPCNAVFGVPLDGAGEDTAFDILALFLHGGGVSCCTLRHKRACQEDLY